MRLLLTLLEDEGVAVAVDDHARQRFVRERGTRERGRVIFGYLAAEAVVDRVAARLVGIVRRVRRRTGRRTLPVLDSSSLISDIRLAADSLRGGRGHRGHSQKDQNDALEFHNAGYKLVVPQK